MRPCFELPSLSGPANRSRRFPNLLMGKRADFPNQVWSTDTTYVQIWDHHMHPTTVIDWHGPHMAG